MGAIAILPPPSTKYERWDIPLPVFFSGLLSRHFLSLVEHLLLYASFPFVFVLVLVHVWCCFRNLVFRVYLSFWFPVVLWGRVSMIVIMTPLISPKYRKEVADRVVMLPISFETRVGFCIESWCCGLPRFLIVFVAGSFDFVLLCLSQYFVFSVYLPLLAAYTSCLTHAQGIFLPLVGFSLLFALFGGSIAFFFLQYFPLFFNLLSFYICLTLLSLSILLRLLACVESIGYSYQGLLCVTV